MRAVPLLRLWSHTQTRASWLMVRRLLEAVGWWALTANSRGGGAAPHGGGVHRMIQAAFGSAAGPIRKPHRPAQVHGYLVNRVQLVANTRLSAVAKR